MTSTIKAQYGTTTSETLTTDAVSGTVKLVRCGKIRQIIFDDAKAPPIGYISLPTLQVADRPAVATPVVLFRDSANVTLFWIRTNGTIGWYVTSANAVYNGSLNWIVP